MLLKFAKLGQAAKYNSVPMSWKLRLFCGFKEMQYWCMCVCVCGGGFRRVDSGRAYVIICSLSLRLILWSCLFARTRLPSWLRFNWNWNWNDEFLVEFIWAEVHETDSASGCQIVKTLVGQPTEWNMEKAVRIHQSDIFWRRGLCSCGCEFGGFIEMLTTFCLTSQNRFGRMSKTSFYISVILRPRCMFIWAQVL